MRNIPTPSYESFEDACRAQRPTVAEDRSGSDVLAAIARELGVSRQAAALALEAGRVQCDKYGTLSLVGGR